MILWIRFGSSDPSKPSHPVRPGRGKNANVNAARVQTLAQRPREDTLANRPVYREVRRPEVHRLRWRLLRLLCQLPRHVHAQLQVPAGQRGRQGPGRGQAGREGQARGCPAPEGQGRAEEDARAQGPLWADGPARSCSWAGRDEERANHWEVLWHSNKWEERRDSRPAQEWPIVLAGPLKVGEVTWQQICFSL